MFILFILISLTFQKNDYELLLEWGKNNSLEISGKLQMNYINENNKTFYTKEKILKNEILLKIPKSITLNIENALNLYGKKFKKLYEEFLPKCKEYKINFMCEQTFLSYMMYKVNKSNKTKNNNFYKYYQYLFNTYESNLDSYPIFYSFEQLYLIQFTSLAYSIDYIKKVYAGEMEIFENDLKLKKIEKDDYYVFRTFVSSKSYNNSGHAYVVPFIDMFNKHPTKYNLKIEADEEIISVIATRDISPSEPLLINCDYLANQNALTLFGITFDEIIDKINTFHIPILNPLILKNHNYENKETNLKLFFNQYIDIQKDKFYEYYIDIYKQISFDLDEDKSELSALKLILENLETLEELNSQINASHIYKYFYQQKDIDNILRLFKADNKIIKEKIELMKKVINNYEKKENKKINKDL